MTERIQSVPRFHDFTQTMCGGSGAQPFVTSNITGKRQEFTSHKQLADACKAAGVVHVPDRQSRIG